MTPLQSNVWQPSCWRRERFGRSTEIAQSALGFVWSQHRRLIDLIARAGGFVRLGEAVERLRHQVWGEATKGRRAGVGMISDD